MLLRRAFGAALLATLASPALAAPLEDIKARGVLRVATTGANKPYTFLGPAGVLAGYDIDWGTAIAAGLGVRAEFIRLDWKGILPGLIARQFDAAMSAVRATPERAAAFDFSAPYGVDDVTIAVPSANTSIHGVEDLHGLVVGTAVGSVQDQFARAQAKAGSIRALPGLPDIMLDLQAGRLDAAVVGRGGAVAFIRETHAPIRLVGSYVGGDLAAVFPKGSTALVAAVNEIIAARRADGTAQAISQRWFGGA